MKFGNEVDTFFATDFYFGVSVFSVIPTLCESQFSFIILLDSCAKSVHCKIQAQQTCRSLL